MKLENIGLIILMIFSFILGYKTYPQFHKPLVVSSQSQTVTGDIKNTTTTTVAYVPKLTKSDSDVNLNLSKPDLTVNINGRTTTFNKDVYENYLFENNKLQLDQTSKVSFSVKVDPIDLTKHYGIGIGYDNGLAGFFTAPLFKDIDINGVFNDKNIGGGVLIRF